MFDRYGEVGLKEGIMDPDRPGSISGGYTFKGNSFEIFEAFFGSTNPFTDYFVKLEGQEEVKCEDPDAPPPIEVTLDCTIYEFYNGSLKKFTFTRDILLPDGRSMDQEECEMTIEVKPGYDECTVLTFPSRGNQAFAKH